MSQFYRKLGEMPHPICKDLYVDKRECRPKPNIKYECPPPPPGEVLDIVNVSVIYGIKKYCFV